MMATGERISFAYEVDAHQLEDLVLGMERQAGINYSLMYHSNWDRRLRTTLIDSSIWAAFAAAVVYAVGIKLAPGGWQGSDLWLFAPAPLVAVVVWLLLRYGSASANRQLYRASARWGIEFDRLHSGQRQVTLDASGLTLATASFDLSMSWIYLHEALVRTEHLVLVFQGMILVIPHSVLPGGAKELAGKIEAWARPA